MTSPHVPECVAANDRSLTEVCLCPICDYCGETGELFPLGTVKVCAKCIEAGRDPEFSGDARRAEVLEILHDSDAVCDFEEESNGDQCGRDPRGLPLPLVMGTWFIDSVPVSGRDSWNVRAVIRCPNHW
jgi:hypothetical protein